MSYDVKLTGHAEKDLKKLDKPAQTQVVKKLDEMKKDPFHDATQLKSEPGSWRRRAGDYRIIFQVEKNKVKVVTVVRIGHRREVYDK